MEILDSRDSRSASAVQEAKVPDVIAEFDFFSSRISAAGVCWDTLCIVRRAEIPRG